MFKYIDIVIIYKI